MWIPTTELTVSRSGLLTDHRLQRLTPEGRNISDQITRAKSGRWQIKVNNHTEIFLIYVTYYQIYVILPPNILSLLHFPAPGERRTIWLVNMRPER